jgi:release factor glutamine methyltransferase
MENSRAGSRPWTPIALLDWSAAYFAGKGIASARFDAERLLAHVLGCSRLELYLHHDQPLAGPELTAFRELVRRRAQREPVPYLTGEVGFWNLTLAIRPGCLIPRPDTETLVEAVLAALRGSERTGAAPPRVLELGTGSAAIPLAVCSESAPLVWIACEREAAALAVARENRARYAEMLAARRQRLWLLQADGFAALQAGFRAELLVSNPPYIPSAAIAALEPEVARYEPRAALDGGADGLAAHRLLVQAATERLLPGGDLLLEIGSDQADAVTALIAARPGLALQEVRRDLEGRPRVVWARRHDA